jgi:hypothetical protein
MRERLRKHDWTGWLVLVGIAAFVLIVWAALALDLGWVVALVIGAVLAGILWDGLRLYFQSR